MSDNSWCLLRIGDGRDEVHELAHASLMEMLPKPDHIVTVDDRDHSLGFAGAIAEGWRQARETGAAWVFHAEMDFTYNAPVPIDRLIAILRRRPNIVQVALKRGPANAEEQAAGGIVELNPDDFHQRHDAGDIYTTQRRFFTTNPSLYPAALCAQGWPQVPRSEGVFSHRLFGADPDACSAYWGAKFDPPMVEHIGTRTGHGY